VSRQKGRARERKAVRGAGDVDGGRRAERRRPLRRLVWPIAVVLLALAVPLWRLLAPRTAAQDHRFGAVPPPRPVVPLPATSPIEQRLREAMERAAADRPPPGDLETRAALARLLLEEKRPFSALWHFRAVQDQGPESAGAAIDTARAVAACGLPALAERLLPEGAPARKEAAYAEIALATGRPDRARRALSAPGGTASGFDALLLLGDAHAAMGDREAARAAYRRAASAEPESALPHDRLGRLALEAGDAEAAKAAFAAARERDPSGVGHLYRMGLAYRAAGEPRAAEQFWQAALASAPAYAPARVALGALERQRGRLPAAAAHLTAAVRADPASEDAQEALAAVMVAQGDRASALYQRGFLALSSERPYRALTHFREMADLAPERIDGPLMIGFAWIQMKQLDRAAEVTRQALERHPSDPRLLERLATLHVLGRNRPKAKEVCEAWQKAAPGSPGPSRLLTRIAREEQRLSDSARYGEEAVARDPNDAAACYELSKTLAALGDPAQAARALELARRAVERNPREADHWHHFGLLLRAAGQTEEAAEALARALDAGSAAPAVGSVLVQLATTGSLTNVARRRAASGDDGPRRTRGDLSGDIRKERPGTARFFANLVTALEARRREADALWRAVYRRPNDAAAQAALAAHFLSYGDLPRARYRLEEVVALRPGDRAAREQLAVVRRLLALRAP
jgi:tetratricopeptide (TPR) repeat protein